MKRRLTLGLGVMAIAVAIASENLIGRYLKAFFLQLPGIDKALHTLEYALVIVLVHALARRTIATTDRGAVSLAVGLSVMLAVLDESVQRLFPARSVETFDFLANLAGITLGWVFVRRPPPRLRYLAAGLALATSAFVAYDTHVTLRDYSRALRFERQHNFVQARVYYQRALESGMRTATLFNELGWVEIESGVGNPHKAVEYAGTALNMQPTNPDVLDTYGWALLHAGRIDEALTALQKAYDASPNMYCIHYHLGSAYVAAGHLDRAKYHFARQLEKPGTREAVFAQQALERLASANDKRSRGDHKQ